MSVSQNYPIISPSLSMDFAAVKALDPRVTFARASSARYYNGVTTAKAEENLLVRSQEFETGWTYNSVSITANTTVAPDGTTTADTLAFADAATTRGYQPFTGNGSAFTFSVFAKYIDKQWIAFRLTDSGGISRFVWFDVQNGVVGTTQTGITASIVASTEGFYRCIATIATTATTNFAMIYGVNGDNSTSNVGQTGSVAAWGAQLEQRSTVTAYTPTTTQPITNYIPTLLTATDNVARFDHNPTTGESLGLLVEEQRTNLLTYSEAFDDASWGKTRLSVTPNVVVAPDGTLTGDKLVEDTTANNSHILGKNANAPTASSDVSATVYLKAGERTFAQIRITDNAADVNGGINSFNVAVNLTTGATGTTFSSGSPLNTAFSVTPVGNGWYRIWIKLTKKGDAVRTDLSIFTWTSANANVNPGYTGNGFSGIYIWGAQLEAGAFPTSYIPTVASQVTRSADNASITGANFSSWYRADEGTLYGEYLAFSTKTTSGRFFTISDGTANNIVMADEFGTARVRVRKDGGSTNSMTSVLGLNGSTKTAIAIKNNDFAVSFNSATAIAGAFQTPSNLNRLEIGYERLNNNYCNTTIKKISYYPIRLTNAQLAALTS